jgi:hypothetical protein
MSIDSAAVEHPRHGLAAYQQLEPSPIEAARRVVLFESEGLQVVAGENCKASSGEPITIEEEFDLPDFADEATVIMNGWSLRYLDDDQHVWEISSYIFSSQVVDRVLRWTAGGVIADKGFDNPFEWCYWFTVVAWDSSVVGARANHTDTYGGASSKYSTQYPIVSTRHQTQGSPLLSPHGGAVLPRGFLLRSGQIDDRHLQHAGFNMSASENVGRPDPLHMTVGAGNTSWHTEAIFQDDGYDHFVFQDVYARIGGAGVSVIQPPFVILPIRENPNIGSAYYGERTENHVIEGIPFEMAVPVLAGWNLRYDFGDEHVERIGVWLSDIEYDRPTPTQGGTLRYNVTSLLRDKNADNSYSFSHNVHVLGFNSRPVIDDGRFEPEPPIA